MEFDVAYILTIFDENRKTFTVGKRMTKTHFAPFVGLEVLFDGVSFGVIKRISWDEDSKLFRCQFEYEVNPLDIDDDLKFQIEMAKRGGFTGFDKQYDNPENS